MQMKLISLGAAPDDGTGSSLRSAGAFVNENFGRLAQSPWRFAVNAVATTPPAGPLDRDRYLVAAGAAGAWGGRAGHVAEWVADSASWHFEPPLEGAMLRVLDANSTLVHEDGAWVPFAGGGGGAFDIAALPSAIVSDVQGVAVATAAGNRKASPAVLRGALGLGSLAGWSESQLDAYTADKADLVGGKVPLSQLPDIGGIGRKVTVANQAARLALAAHDDITFAVQVDTATLHVLDADANPAVAANWTSLGSTVAAGVTSVFGRTGAVSFQPGDAAAEQIGYSGSIPGATTVKAALEALKASDQAKADLVGGKIPRAQLPDMGGVGRKVTVANQAARLALAPHDDITFAVQVDTGTLHVLDAGANPAVAANWTSLGATAASGVSSVFGRTGAVSFQAGDAAAEQIAYSGSIAGASTVKGALEKLNATPAITEIYGQWGCMVSTSGTTRYVGLSPVPNVAGTYSLPNLTVNVFGQVVAASSGTVPIPTDFANAIFRAGRSALHEAFVSGTYTVPPVSTSRAHEFLLILTGSTVITLRTLVQMGLSGGDTAFLALRLRQGGAGSHTPTIQAPSGVTLMWDGGGSQPAHSTAAGSETHYVFTYTPGDYHGEIRGQRVFWQG